MRVERALISVSDKRGVAELGQALSALGVEILSTGGTAKLLREAGVKVRDVSEATGFPEMLGGRVKTLHPKIHGGILARRDDPEHLAALKQHGIEPIDLVVVNLYPFAQAAMRAEASPEELIEEIDIGGPTLIRAAAKNCHSVAVVTSPDDYPMVIAELREHRGISLASRVALARKAFALTASYDSLIAGTLEQVQVEGEQVTRRPAEGFPAFFAQPATKVMDLRYGENPHQRAALYKLADVPAEASGVGGQGVAGAKQLQGKELSYNNLLDLDAAWDLACEFTEPVAVIIKHTNPAGVAVAATQHEAFAKALACDSVSAFGGILGFNQPVTAATAEAIGKLFLECIAAPGYEAGALEIFAKKKNLRLMEITPSAAVIPLVPSQAEGSPASSQKARGEGSAVRVRSISGGLLVQDKDCARFDMAQFKTVTKRAPTAEELPSLLFAWVVCKHAKSNAIVYARDGQTVGVGAGQMSRVDSVKLGAMKARDLGHAEQLKGSVVASDAFFPFPDGVEEAAKAGATAVIQPGGSVRDEEVIAAADRLGLAMVLTGIRHFRH